MVSGVGPVGAGYTQGPSDPVGQYIDHLMKWAQQYGAGSPQTRIVEDIQLSILTLSGKIPPATLDDMLTKIKQDIFSEKQGQDIYLRYFGLTPDQMKDLSNKVFNGSLAPPQFTQMDNIFKQVSEWQKKSKPADQPLIQWLLGQLKPLGSSDSQLDNFQNTMQHFVDGYPTIYSDAPGKDTFLQITQATSPFPLSPEQQEAMEEASKALQALAEQYIHDPNFMMDPKLQQEALDALHKAYETLTDPAGYVGSVVEHSLNLITGGAATAPGTPAFGQMMNLANQLDDLATKSQ